MASSKYQFFKAFIWVEAVFSKHVKAGYQES
jgi:hypothetical protein